MSEFVWPGQDVVELAEGVVAIIQGQGEAGVSNAGIVADNMAAAAGGSSRG